MLAVLVSWEWTEERIAEALRGTGYLWREAVLQVAESNIWKPHDNRLGDGVPLGAFLELLKTIERAQASLKKRAGAGAKPPAAVTAPEERGPRRSPASQAHAEGRSSWFPRRLRP